MVEQLFYQGGGHGVQLGGEGVQVRDIVGAIAGIRAGGPVALQLGQRFVNLGAADVLGVFPDRCNGGNSINGFPPVQEFFRLPGHQFLGLGDFRLDTGVTVFGSSAQGVNVAQANPLQQSHFRLNIPGYRNVDEEQGPPAAPFHHFLHLRSPQQVIRRGGGADNGVGVHQGLV